MKFYILEISFLLNKIPEKLTNVFGVQSGGGVPIQKLHLVDFSSFFLLAEEQIILLKKWQK